MKQHVIFCTGISGSGKSHFIENYLSGTQFYKLKSATTRPARSGEQDSREYYFVNDAFFDSTPLVTKLWVNEDFWNPGMPKWMYGVPEFEVFENMNTNFVYDVIQPKYVRQMQDWFIANKLTDKYDFKTLYFLPPNDNFKIASQRANMPDDAKVRTANTCNPIDFLRADIDVFSFVKNSKEECIVPKKLTDFLNSIRGNRTK